MAMAARGYGAGRFVRGLSCCGRGGPMDGVASSSRPAETVLPFVDELSDARGGGGGCHVIAALVVGACFILSSLGSDPARHHLVTEAALRPCSWDSLSADRACGPAAAAAAHRTAAPAAAKSTDRATRAAAASTRCGRCCEGNGRRGQRCGGWPRGWRGHGADSLGAR